MSSEPLVSIVTPCLDPGRRLARCLDSVAAQTYPHVEHIVVDGGSRDGSVELLRARGVAHVSEPDRGQSEAINKGFAAARGEWLGWLNADDVLLPRAVEHAIEATQAVPGAGWVYGDCLMRSTHGEHRWTPPPELRARMFERGNPVPQPGSLVARWALERVGPLDERLHLVMDYDLWLRLFEAGIPSVHVAQTLSVFELHDASKSRSRGAAEFRFEEAVSLLGSGRLRAAAEMLGVAAAHAARQPTGATDPVLLDREIRNALERLDAPVELDRRLVRASAWAQAAENGLYGRPRRFGYLLAAEAWSTPETRRRLATALVRGGVRRLRKPGRRTRRV